MLKKLNQIGLIAMAYVGVVIGAGFASGQEVLQFFVSYGWWGILGGVLMTAVLPIVVMATLQFGSYFQARSHNVVFKSITSPLMARLLDYALSLSQFSFGFIMIAGAGANLNQQFGLPLWVGACLMVGLILIVGMFNATQVTKIIGSITPLMIVLLLIASLYAFLNINTSLQGAHEYAIQNVTSALPHWSLAFLSYTGNAVFSGTAMAIIIGGTNLNPRIAGWGGYVGGVCFGALLLLVALGLLLQGEQVADTALPTLALLTNISPQLGTVTAIIIYLMIFNTAIAMFYALGKRLTVTKPAREKPVLIGITLLGFALSFFDFTLLVTYVLPIIGWTGLVMIVVLMWAWCAKWRAIIKTESDDRELIRTARQTNAGSPRWSDSETAQLHTAFNRSSLDQEGLKQLIGDKAYQELRSTRTS